MVCLTSWRVEQAEDEAGVRSNAVLGEEFAHEADHAPMVASEGNAKVACDCLGNLLVPVVGVDQETLLVKATSLPSTSMWLIESGRVRISSPNPPVTRTPGA